MPPDSTIATDANEKQPVGKPLHNSPLPSSSGSDWPQAIKRSFEGKAGSQWPYRYQNIAAPGGVIAHI